MSPRSSWEGLGKQMAEQITLVVSSNQTLSTQMVKLHIRQHTWGFPVPCLLSVCKAGGEEHFSEELPTEGKANRRNICLGKEADGGVQLLCTHPKAARFRLGSQQEHLPVKPKGFYIASEIVLLFALVDSKS